MLLKPATPLTILLVVAFVLLLLSCLSTPIVKGIPLATYENVDYGVFGYCQGSKCTNVHVGYSVDSIQGESDDFNLPSSTRKSLSSILIVHPVAAFLTLVCLILAVASHFHGPSHSPRFLLALLILFLPTLLVSLLAFLVDILLFVPHLQWGGWIVLAATILLVCGGVVTCAMRRTLVSRKARKRRIAENAEMSGENYYNRQNAAAALAPEPAPVLIDAKPPTIASAHAATDSGPTVASFRTNTRDSDDDRTPLNTQVPLNDPSASEGQFPSRHPTPYHPQEEAGFGPYGNGQVMRNTSDPRLRQQYSNGSMESDGRGAPAGYAPRGRGTYPPRAGFHRGGPYSGAPRGPPGGRGGYMGAPPRGGRGGMMPGRGAHRGNYGNYGSYAGYNHHTGYQNRGYDAYSRPQYTDDPYDSREPASPMREPSPGPIGMAVSPETVGQAIEMTPQPRAYDAHRSNITMSNEAQPHTLSIEGPDMSLESPTSLYSRTESYVPARAAWGNTNDHHRTLSPRPSPAPVQEGSDHGSYVEDVDPRFVHRPSQAGQGVPSALTPGGAHF
ncbi:hypothetical protein N7468_009353 [Penicillium chermesinum]|uniref:Pali-domain-containing protein n=1 Tax=Penicillium chermesinum TaxID=63820 RepID=A0A9W9NK43_9EURO|nr:uncharacterized protein N7468_009353 [Penicillium chermesinum]KAJ5220149.1 hypothetical protein N7468_009353 [Penicillium chermesinum]KAJ6157599.1 hypothetical protein N7470_005191 [Penicillium chermesinum]